MTPTRPDNTLPSAPPQELLPQTASPHPDGPNAAPSPAAPLTATDKTMSNTTLEPSPTPPIGPDAPASAASAVAASTSPADANLTTPPDLTPSLPPAATASTLPGSADSADSPASPAAPSSADNFRAAFMFTLAFGYLLVVAGLVHRATTPTVTQVELFLIYGCLILLWPVFAVEALLGVWQRDRRQPLRRVVWRLLLVLLFPPFRLGWLDPRWGLVWLPRLGWCCPGSAVFKKLERAFAVPMVLFAFLILPLLLIEYLQAEQIKENVLLALGLDIGIAVIWIAFATEFILKVSVHPRPLSLAKDRWLDVAIVVLPMLEFLLTKWIDAAPLARLVRLGRALSPEQIARLQQLYRLRGLATKAFHALLLVEGVARLLGQTPQKRLARIQQRIEELQEEIAELQKEAAEWQALIDRVQAPPPSSSPTTPTDSTPPPQ